jgi:hypothetical protein
VLRRAADQLVLTAPAQLAQRRVDAQEPAVQADQGHAGRRAGEGGLERRVEVAVLSLGRPAVAEVLEPRDAVEGLPSWVSRLSARRPTKSSTVPPCIAANAGLTECMIPLTGSVTLMPREAPENVCSH